jgi:hypothetical protein
LIQHATVSLSFASHVHFKDNTDAAMRPATML